MQSSSAEADLENSSQAQSAPGDREAESGLRVAQDSKLNQQAPTPSKAPKRPKRTGLGLKAKLLLWLLPLVNLILLGIWFVSTTTARTGLMELSSRNLSTTSHDLAGALADALSDAYADARTTAALDLPVQAIETGDAKNMTWYANELVRIKSKYIAIVVTDLEGEIVSANTEDNTGKAISPSLIGQSFENVPWLKQAIASEKGEGALVDPSRPKVLLPMLDDSARVVGFSMPVFDIMDDAVGTVTAFVSMNFLAERLSGLTHTGKLGLNSLAAIVDSSGELIELPPALQKARTTWQAAHWPAPNTENAVARWTGPSETPYFLSQDKINAGIPALNWQLAALRTVAAVEAPVAAMGQRLLWASLLAVLAATLVLALVAGRFVGPISRLTETIANTVKAADFKPVAIESRDEIGVLAQAFNRMFQTIVDHEQNLERRVEERTAQLDLAKREVSDILDNMQQGVFTVSAGAKVDPQYSAYSQELFGDVEIAGADLLTLLKVSVERSGQEEYSRMNCWLQTIFGADDFQWMLSEDEGLRRIVYPWTRGDESETRIIELEYAPIYVDEEISKVMVLARDITALEALKDEVEQKDQENRDNIDRVAQLNNLDADLFETFISESGVLLGECAKAVAGLKSSGGDKTCIDQLFRSMHTLKGNSRIFKITRLQDKAHAVENQFDEIRATGTSLTPDQVDDVEQSVNSVGAELASFEALGRRILLGDKGSSETKAVSALEFVDRTLQDLPAVLENIETLANEDEAKLVQLRARFQGYSSEVDRLGLSTLARPVAATLELLEYESPLPIAVEQLVQEFEASLAAARQLALDLKNPEEPATFLMEAADILARVMDALAKWDNNVDNPEHVNALLRHLDTLLGICATDKLESLHAHTSQLSELLTDVRECGNEALTPQTAVEVRRRLQTLRALVEDGHAFLGHEPSFGGALSTLRRMVLGLDHQFLNWNRASKPEGSAQAVYHRAHDCKLELESRGLNWLTGEALLLEKALAALDLSRRNEPLSVRSTERVEHLFVEFLSKYRLLQALGTELRSRKNPITVLREVQTLAESVDPRTPSRTPKQLQALQQKAQEAHLPTVSRLALSASSQDLRDCIGLLLDARVLVEVAQSGKGQAASAIAKVPETRIETLVVACAELSRLVSQAQPLRTTELQHTATALQHHAWSLTASPVGPLFARMRKMVFALGVELDRGVEELRFDGADVLVDAGIVDKLRDILIHTLRNSVDHGIESRRDREAAGKPSRGKIKISCKENDGQITVVVQDDGAGIDLKIIRSKALSKGLLSEQEVDKLNEAQTLALIFLPGFSTNSEVTDVSGRGVGMDVVKCSVEELGGSIELSSVLGLGTTTHIRFPTQRLS